MTTGSAVKAGPRAIVIVESQSHAYEMGRPVMGNKLVLVIGGNFGGLTAALEVKAELGGDVDVTVVSATDRFLFNPSLIWLPFGKRSAADITFPLRPVFEANGVGFVHAEATAIDPATRTVTTTSGRYYYDYLVIATGSPLRSRASRSAATRSSARWPRSA